MAGYILMASGQLTCCLLSCSPGGQVSLAVGLVPEVISLSLLRCRRCLAGLGVAYGSRPQLLVGGCMVWDCRRIGGPKGHFFPAGDWVVAVHLLLLAESPCWPVEAGCWWVGNMTCHLQRGGTPHIWPFTVAVIAPMLLQPIAWATQVPT